MLDEVLAQAGVQPAAQVPDGVEVVRRGDRLFVLNHTGNPVTVAGTTVDGGGAAVVPVVAQGG